jgi:4-alpha-glucanotransferase
MWALQRQLAKDPRSAFGDIPQACVAAFNTHDHPTFSGWWAEVDVRERTRLGLIDAAAARADGARRERARVWLARRLGTRARLDPATLAALGASRAETVIVNLEDLWGEKRPQNVPGTSVERPNWRRKARLSLDAIERSRAVRLGLTALDRARRAREGS